MEGKTLIIASTSATMDADLRALKIYEERAFLARYFANFVLHLANGYDDTVKI